VVEPIQIDFASASADRVLSKLKSSPKGLGDAEARKRFVLYGPNESSKQRRKSALEQLFSKFLKPLIIVLIIDGAFAWYIGEVLGASFILGMILVSVFISFIQEYRSSREVEGLLAMVHTVATVIRGGKEKEIHLRNLVPGDVVKLCAGDIIPADVRLISCKDLFINQAALTGESFPVEKFAELNHLAGRETSPDATLAYMGTSVSSGTALGLVIKTGTSTRFGEIARDLSIGEPETSFDKGIREFTWLMIRAMVVLVLVIFLINALFKHDVLEAFLFSLAVAVGLTPEMLPTIVAMNLTKGALFMAKKKVIVKRLAAIQNFGAMDILCTDKTGTLTLDNVVLVRHSAVDGKEDEDVLRHAYINSYYQTGLKNLLDRAILKYEKLMVKQYKKVDEVPFDFSRRIMSVIVEFDHTHRLIAKGAPEEILKRCTQYELDGKVINITSHLVPNLRAQIEALNADGFRVLAVAYKDVGMAKKIFSKEDESDLILKGYVAFLDPPKPSADKAILSLEHLGVRVKVLTGDTPVVTRKICTDVGLDASKIVIGDEIESLSEEALGELAEKTTVFARLSPLQKERIIQALKKKGHTVGYLGDGINDAPPLKAADIGISVNNGVDIAKESADLILLEKNLLVLHDGVMEGRKTFGNILKYVRMGASSNLGNMISMTGASLFLPFLPMLPIQVLLNNFLYDISQMAIPTDRVDEDFLTKSKPWNIASIKRFMLLIGPVSSVFDFLTFGILFFLFHSSAPLFQTCWFLESLFTQTLVIHVIRTAKRPFMDSKPSRFLLGTSIGICLLALYLPFSPFATALGFVHPSIIWFPVLGLIVFFYLICAQLAKQLFIRRYGYE